MNHITEQIKASKAEFDTQFPRVQCVTPGNEFYTDMLVNAEGKEIKSFLLSAQIKIIEAFFKDVGEGVDYITHMVSKKAFDEGNIINQERRRIRTILEEAITEAKNI